MKLIININPPSLLHDPKPKICLLVIGQNLHAFLRYKIELPQSPIIPYELAHLIERVLTIILILLDTGFNKLISLRLEYALFAEP